MSQGESAVTEPYGSATDEAGAGRAPEEAVAVEPDAGPVVDNGVVDNGVDESAAGNGMAADTGLAIEYDWDRQRRAFEPLLAPVPSQLKQATNPADDRTERDSTCSRFPDCSASGTRSSGRPRCVAGYRWPTPEER